MFPGNNPQFPQGNGQQAANNLNNMAAMYLHPSLGMNSQAYSQLYQENHELELARQAKLKEDISTEKENKSSDDDSKLSLVERIYAENRRKAAESHAAAKGPHLPPLFAGCVPLYQNPSDCPLVQETIERYKTFKPVLVKMLTEKKQRECLAQKYQTEKYNVMYAEWKTKDERYCKSQKKMARDEKHREIFEKAFPELRKAREERERSARTNSTNGSNSKKSDVDQLCNGPLELDKPDQTMDTTLSTIITSI